MDWNKAVTTADSATALAAAIDALGTVSASSDAGAVVTVTAAETGTAGNLITMATTDATHLTLSASTLSGGENGVVAAAGDGVKLTIRPHDDLVPGYKRISGRIIQTSGG